MSQYPIVFSLIDKKIKEFYIINVCFKSAKQISWLFQVEKIATNDHDKLLIYQVERKNRTILNSISLRKLLKKNKLMKIFRVNSFSHSFYIQNICVYFFSFVLPIKLYNLKIYDSLYSTEWMFFLIDFFFLIVCVLEGLYWL